MKQFFANIDTPGGHITIAYILLWTGVVVCLIGWGGKIEQLTTIGVGLISSAGTGIFNAFKDRNGSKVSIVPTQTKQEPPVPPAGETTGA